MKKIIKFCFLVFLFSTVLNASLPFKEFYTKHNAAILIINPKNGAIVDANPAAQKFYGYNLQEIVNLTIQDINQFTKEQVQEEIANAKKENRSYFIFQHKAANDTIKTVEVYSHPYVEDGKELLISLIHDISKQRLQEKDLWGYQNKLEEIVAQKTAQLVQANKEEKKFFILFSTLLSTLLIIVLYLYYKQNRLKKRLLDKNKEFQNLLNATTGIGIIATDKEGVIQSFNIGAQKMLGYDEKELVGKTTPAVFHDKTQLVQMLPKNSDTNNLFLKWLKHTVENETNYGSITMYKKDKTSFQASLKLSKIYNSEEKFKGYLGIIEDRSKELAYKKQLERLNKNLKQEVEKQVQQIQQKDKLLQEQAKLAAMGEMIGAIAHQWRQPLNALSINIQNLDDDYEEGLITQDFVNKFIQNQTKTINFMSKTIDDFRNFFKTDREKMSFNISTVIHSIYNILNAQLQNHNITLTFNDEDFMIQSYKSEMHQVLLNIIANSKDAIIEKELRKGTIDISIDASNKKLLICDNGGGVEEDKLNRIFEPYYTTKEQGKGTGIGLYMTRVIIVDHIKGSINAQNSKDGLCIIIQF